MEAQVIKRINQIFAEEEAESYDERHPEIVKERQNWRHVLTKYLDQNKSLRILDVGAGTGFVPSVISSYTLSLTICSDISKKMLDVARGKLSSIAERQFEFIVCDAEQLPLVDNSIDVITLNSTLHHLPNYPSFLSEASRTLSTHGLLFIMHEPNRLFYNSQILVKLNQVAQLYLALRNRVAAFLSSKSSSASTKNKPELFEKVNQCLIAEKLIQAKLSPGEIQALVDIHSPTASGIPDKTRGFTLSEITSYGSFRLLEFKTYSFLGKIDANKDKFLSLLNFVCSKVLRNKGYMFWVVLRKE